MNRTFSPAKRLAGTLRVPGDKSISHRALILAAMTKGESILSGLAPGADVESTRNCLSKLGAHITVQGPGALQIRGNGWTPPSSASLDAGNSGTTMRLLAGALAGRPGRFHLEGDESLSRRPMGRIAEPLERMGAKVELSGDALPPMDIYGAQLKGIDYTLPVASAQVKAAVLLAGLQAEGTTTVVEPVKTRDHTERMLDWLGAPVQFEDDAIRIEGSTGLFEGEGFSLDIPGDFSSAAYFLVAACLCKRGEVTLEGVGLNNSRTGLLDVLGAMGAKLEVMPSAANPEPYGTMRVSSSDLEYAEVGKSLIPRIIDELPLVALAATQAEGTTKITEAGELRVKESDRIALLAKGLSSLGASVEERPDGLTIEGPTPLTGGVVASGGDHRIALTFAVAGTIAAGPVTVEGWECVAISYPDFENDLETLLR